MPKAALLPLHLTHLEASEIRKSLACVEYNVRLAYGDGDRLDNALRELALGAAHLAARLGIDAHGVGVDERDVVAPPEPAPIRVTLPRPSTPVQVLGVGRPCPERALLETECGLILGSKSEGWFPALQDAVERYADGSYDFVGFGPAATGIGVEIYTARRR